MCVLNAFVNKPELPPAQCGQSSAHESYADKQAVGYPFERWVTIWGSTKLNPRQLKVKQIAAFHPRN